MQKVTIHSILILFLLTSLHLDGVAQKTDTIVHINENNLTGELKKMEYNIFTWSMDGMGTINIEIPYVRTIISQKQFEILMKDGTVYYSGFEASERMGEVIIDTGTNRIPINIRDIIEIHPIKGSFFKRISGNVSLGGNFSKSSQLSTVAFSGNLQYRNKKTTFNTDWFLNLSYQKDSLITNNSEVNVNYQNFLGNNWYSLVGLGRSQNLQLGIRERYDLVLGGLKDLVNTSTSTFYMALGVTGITERPYDENRSTREDIAGVARLGYDVFKYTNPKISLKSNIVFIPYFTGDSRYRVNFNLNPNVSLIGNNFKVGFNFYYYYDSRPPENSLSNDDYGINLQLTYSIN